MRVFLSWSGETSKQLALTLREWLPDVIQALKPFMSAEDIEKGARWSQTLTTELTNQSGILCITADSVDAPWLNFEAGALWKATDRSYVIPYLHGLEATDITGPVPALFQIAVANHDDTRRMLGTLNRALGELALKDATLDKAFETHWPELEERLGHIPQRDAAVKRRDTYEVLTEILTHVRALAAPAHSQRLADDAPLSPVQGVLMRRLARDYLDYLEKTDGDRSVGEWPTYTTSSDPSRSMFENILKLQSDARALNRKPDPEK